MDQVEQQFTYLYTDCMNNGFTLEELHNLCNEHLRTSEAKKEFKKTNYDKQGNMTIYTKTSRSKKISLKCCFQLFLVIFLVPIVSLILYGSVYCVLYGVDELAQLVASAPCLVHHNEISLEVTRPLFDCTICQNLSTVPVERNISKERFEKLYAYTGIPVVVKDVTNPSLQVGDVNTWERARERFTFKFFKDLYESSEGALDMVESECQFFRYMTDFKTLSEVFSMSKEMSEMKEEKWYVGWSNCVPEIEKELRQYYKTPYFIPDDSESSSIDWIFMGGWGYGAPMHIDNVERPSWQAQLSGRKTWILAPPAECEATCYKLQVTVDTGDIIVLDTNQWFHSTYIHPEKISITIGSEYD